MRTCGSALIVVAVLAALAGPARAGDGESALSLSVGYGIWSVPGEEKDTRIGPDGGAVLGVEYERGFGEAWSWRVAAAGGGYAGGGWSGSGWAGAGIVYRFDVLKYVPYAEVSAGGVVLAGGPLAEARFEPAAEAGGGLDVLVDRELSWGLEARVGVFPGEIVIFTIGLRGTHRWGFF